MTCGFCRQQQQDGFQPFKCGGIDTTDKCRREFDKVPKLDKDNETFRDNLLFRALPGILAGDGGDNFDAIERAFAWHRVPDGQRPVLHDRFLVVIDAIEEIREQIREQQRRNRRT